MAARVDLISANNLGQTPVHAAVMRGSIRVLEKLLEQSAPYTVKDRFGRTPMQLACLHRWPVVRTASHGCQERDWCWPHGQ